MIRKSPVQLKALCFREGGAACGGDAVPQLINQGEPIFQTQALESP